MKDTERERESAVCRRQKGDLFLNVGKQRHFLTLSSGGVKCGVWSIFRNGEFFILFLFDGMSAKYVPWQQVA